MRKRSSNNETLGSQGADDARKMAGHTIREENRRRSGRAARSEDVNETAFAVVAAATGQGVAPIVPEDVIKDVMRQMGRRGGLKGGKARAANLTPAKRKAIAKKAAAARWSAKAGQK